LLVNTAFRQPTHRRPIWLMGQAGIFVKKWAEETKQSYLQMLLDTESATKLSLKPFDVFKVDGISIFTDSALPLIPMGFKLDFDNMNVKLANPVRTLAQAAKVKIPDVNKDFEYITNTITNLRQLSAEVPIIGVISGPFSLAALMIEGSPNYYFPITKAVMFSYPQGLKSLLEKAEETLKQLFQAQIEAGAELILISDPYAGKLSSMDYQKFALPYVQNLIADVNHSNIPIIYHTDSSSGRLNQLLSTGADVLTVDWRTNINDALSETEHKSALQGNFDPCLLLGNHDSISQYVKLLLTNFGKEYGLIGSLGSKVFSNSNEADVAFFVRKFKEFSRAFATK
jgi:uroporphyrinogen decarboxylase